MGRRSVDHVHQLTHKHVMLSVQREFLATAAVAVAFWARDEARYDTETAKLRKKVRMFWRWQHL